ncbi:hypothetical protein MUG87_09070 [Ectobacillus sp. JY-23]|uniref:hypothetical protein n=1 Tax=Ectobacillus sp. JY-23 TaxID=2933872 RepID=UPI001FF16EDF|nr:hypothetical protein [Ectobacillus sp. JY-23]UOY94222.1 hypothetical protein MUG87_09070 [Ectobacillus sp. JY-23]
MITSKTSYFTYGVYIIKSVHEQWLESFIIGHSGANVFMESNIFIEKDSMTEAVEHGVERHGCFQVISRDPYRLRLVREMTEAEKNAWNEWHRLYRDLKWKIKSILSYQANPLEDCGILFSDLQAQAQHILYTYPVTIDEHTALQEMLDDLEASILNLGIEVPKISLVPAIESEQVQLDADHSFLSSTTDYVIEYLQRFSRLSHTLSLIAESDNPTIVHIQNELKIECAWLQVKILRELGLEAEHDEQHPGQLLYLRMDNHDVHPFQAESLKCLFHNFGRVNVHDPRFTEYTQTMLCTLRALLAR